MKVTRKFIEGFVEGCYENGLTEKQASWLLDRYIAEGNGEIMEKSAAGKSILNLLLLLLALGGGAYGLDRLGGTNTALGKWLKDNLGAGNWGIKDALEGLFAPAANAATTAATAPAPATNPAPTVAAAQGADNKSGEDQVSASQFAGPWGARLWNSVTGKDSSNIGDTLKSLVQGDGKKLINMAGKPTQITATPPTPNVSLAPVPKAQAPEATWPDLNLPDIPEAEPSVDNASIPVDLESPEVRGQVYAAFGPAAERQRRKAYHQEMRDMTNNALNALAPMDDPLGEDTQLQEGVDHASKIKDLQRNLDHYELMRQNERAKASLQRKAKLQEYIPLFKQKEGPLEIPYENVDFPEDKNGAPIRDNRASLSIPKPTSKSQSTWFSMVPPVDTNEMKNYLHPDKPKEKTVGEHLLDSVRNAPAGMTY